jgi:hypothetical protein
MWMRSATSKTCGMLCEISTMGMPRARTSWISSSTRRLSLTPSAAVGSSMITNLGPEGGGARHRHALALAARQGLDRLVDVLDRHQAELGELLPGEGLHPAMSSIFRTRPSGPGLRISRPMNMLSAIDSAGDRASVLVDRLDACAPRIQRARRSAPVAPRARSRPRRAARPRQHLDQVDLPAPLSPITARISPGMKVEVGMHSAVTRP